MKLGIVIDSTLSVQPEIQEKYDVEIAKLAVMVDGVAYTDQVDITTSDVITALEQDKKVTTSQPSPDLFVKSYEALRDKGCDHIVVFTISGSLSGTYQSATIAKDLVEGLEIEVIDSLSSGMAGDLLTNETIRLYEEKKPFVELVKHLKEFTKQIYTILTIDNLNTLLKSGRLSKTQAMIGNLLSMKPMIKTDEVGKLDLAAKIRSTKKAIAYLVSEVKKTVADGEEVIISIGHIKAKERFDQISEAMHTTFDKVKIIASKEIPPVLAVHLGKGGYGICWYSR